MRAIIPSLFLCVCALVAGTAWAVDGVVEINQAQALAGGVTSGDAPGFPISITQSGSYRLTSDLTVANVNVTAIDLADVVNHVTIDLNGFSIKGPVLCTAGNPVVCTPTGNGQGITGFPDNSNVTVKDGTIRGFAVRGIILGDGARIERVRAIGNGSDGIYLNDDASVEESTASLNGSNGIRCAYGCRISRCNASENGSHGLYASLGGSVTASVARANVVYGIYALAGGNVIGNTARSNLSYGMRLESGSFGHNAFSDNNGSNAAAQISGAGRIEIAPNLCGTALCP